MCKPLLLAISTLFMISSTLQIIKLKFELETEEDRKIITFTKQFDDNKTRVQNMSFSSNTEFIFDDKLNYYFKTFKIAGNKLIATTETSEDKEITIVQTSYFDPPSYLVSCSLGGGYLKQIVQYNDPLSHKRLIM